MCESYPFHTACVLNVMYNRSSLFNDLVCEKNTIEKAKAKVRNVQQSSNCCENLIPSSQMKSLQFEHKTRKKFIVPII